MPIRFTLGPTSKPSETRILENINLSDILEITRSAKKFMDTYGRVPSTITRDKMKLGPGALLEATAKTILYYSEHGSLPERIRVHGLPDKHIEELTLLQSWTMRPAVLVDN